MCIICNRDLPPIHFEIEQDLGFITYKNKVSINKDICKYCFIPESLSYLVTPSKYYVKIELYSKNFEKNFWKESEWDRDELMTLSEVWEGISEEGIICSKQTEKRNLIKIAKSWVNSWDPALIFYLDVPDGQTLSLKSTSFIKRSDYNDLIKKPRVTDENGRRVLTFLASHRHKVSKERQKELWDLGYLRYDIHDESKELVPKFANNLKNRTRVCVCCGEIKKHDEFRTNGNRKKEHYIVWECLDCEKKRAKKYYIENREQILERAASPKYKQARKAYDKSPQGKYSNALRRRLKRYLKTSFGGKSPASFNKNTGITNRELVHLLEDLSEDWMNPNNYGAGKNFNHEDVWHIDHVIPLCLWDKYKFVNPFYDISLPEKERIGPNHWSNLRPLCAKENMSRGFRDLDFEDVKGHYDKIRDLYPDRGVGEINLSTIGVTEVKKEETCEQIFLNV
jgi:hypothetical protein